MTFACPVIIHYGQLENGKQPYAIHVDAEDIARSGLPAEDIGARLLGFGPRGEQRVTVLTDAARDNPESVVGLVATFGFGNVWAWDIPVESLEVRS